MKQNVNQNFFSSLVFTDRSARKSKDMKFDEFLLGSLRLFKKNAEKIYIEKNLNSNDFYINDKIESDDEKAIIFKSKLNKRKDKKHVLSNHGFARQVIKA